MEQILDNKARIFYHSHVLIYREQTQDERLGVSILEAVIRVKE